MKIYRLWSKLLLAALAVSFGMAPAGYAASETVLPTASQKAAAPISASAIEDVIVKALQIPADAQSRTTYYYQAADLDGDGAEDVLAVVAGPYTSGTGGHTMFWLAPDKKGNWQIRQQWTLVRLPLIITDDWVHGHKGLIVRRSGGGADPAWVFLSYGDGRYTTVNEGTVLPAIEQR